MSWTAPFKDAALKQAQETGQNWLTIASRMRTESGVVPKSPRPVSDCAKKSEDDCKADESCSWRKGGVTKTGKTRNGYCAKKSAGRPKLESPRASTTGRKTRHFN